MKADGDTPGLFFLTCGADSEGADYICGAASVRRLPTQLASFPAVKQAPPAERVSVAGNRG